MMQDNSITLIYEVHRNKTIYLSIMNGRKAKKLMYRHLCLHGVFLKFIQEWLIKNFMFLVFGREVKIYIL